MFEALVRAGVPIAQADEIVSQLDACAGAGAHTWVSERSTPHGSDEQFDDRWFKGVRAVSSLLRIADNTTAQRWRAESNALLLAYLQQQAQRQP